MKNFHVALVVFVWAEDVEILHADDTRQPTLALGKHVEVLLRLAVEIERMESREIVIAIVHAGRAIAVGGR